MLEKIWDIGTDILFWYFIFLVVMTAIKVWIRIFIPIDRFRYIVFEYSEEFSSIYGEPTFLAKHGCFFQSQAQVKAEELTKKGIIALAARNIEKAVEQKEKESNGLDSKYTCA